MRGRLYLGAFACLVAGAVAGRFLSVAVAAPLAAVLTLAALLCVCLMPRQARTVAIAAAFAVLGMLIMFLTCQGARAGMLPRLSARRAEVGVTGRVAGRVVEGERGVSFIMAVREVREGGKSWITRENVLVWADDAGSASRVAIQGASVSVKGRLATPGGEDDWLLERGAACTISAGRGMIRRAPGPPDRVAMLINGVRQAISASYRRIFDPHVSGFIEGVTLSRLDGIDPQVLADLRNAGLSHVVAVSGLHVGSAAILALALLSIAGAGRKTRYAGAATVALAVAGMAAFRPSAVRALLMGCLGFGAAMFGREYDSLSALSLAGILIVFSNPMSVFDPGFQYSFAAALGIVLGARMKSAGDPISGIRALLVVSATAQLGMLPIVLARGEGVPVTALAANIVAVPLVGPILFTSWAAAAVSVPSAWLGRLCAHAPAAMARLILGTASVMSRVPRSGLHRGAFAAAALLLYAGGLCALVLAARRGGAISRPLAAIAVSIALLFTPLVPLPGLNSTDRLTMLDVGQGDAALIQDGTGANVLVDGGPDGRTVLDKLEERGVSRLDLVVLTHPHSDHLAGLVDVVRSIPVGRILDSGITDGHNEDYREFRMAAMSKGVARTVAREGQVIQVSRSTRLEVLHPVETAGGKPESAGYDNLNDCSIVIMAGIGGARVLLAGDIEAEGQRDMLGLHPDLSCDVLKVPHHGDARAMTRELVGARGPSLALVSVGRDNNFGHPSERCLELAQEYGARLFRTDEDGDIELFFAGGRISVRTRRAHR